MGSLNFRKDNAEDKYTSFLIEFDEYFNDAYRLIKLYVLQHLLGI